MVDFRGHRWRWPTHPGLQNGGDRAAERCFVFFLLRFNGQSRQWGRTWTQERGENMNEKGRMMQDTNKKERTRPKNKNQNQTKTNEREEQKRRQGSFLGDDGDGCRSWLLSFFFVSFFPLHFPSKVLAGRHGNCGACEVWGVRLLTSDGWVFGHAVLRGTLLHSVLGIFDQSLLVLTAMGGSKTKQRSQITFHSR